MKYLIALLLVFMSATTVHARGGAPRGGAGRGRGTAPGSGAGKAPSSKNKPNTNTSDYIEALLREESNSDRANFLLRQRDLSLVDANNEQIENTKVFESINKRL